MSAILVKADDWEGLYVNFKLVSEGHTLNEGEERVIYFARLAKEHDFDLLDMKIETLSDNEERYLEEAGSLPENLFDIQSMYEKYKNWRNRE